MKNQIYYKYESRKRDAELYLEEQKAKNLDGVIKRKREDLYEIQTWRKKPRPALTQADINFNISDYFNDGVNAAGSHMVDMASRFAKVKSFGSALCFLYSRTPSSVNVKVKQIRVTQNTEGSLEFIVGGSHFYLAPETNGEYKLPMSNLYLHVDDCRKRIQRNVITEYLNSEDKQPQITRLVKPLDKEDKFEKDGL